MHKGKSPHAVVPKINIKGKLGSNLEIGIFWLFWIDRTRNIRSFFTRNDLGSHHEWSLTCCTVCWKVHPTPSACVTDRTLNDHGHMPNDRLTLDFTRTFTLRWANVCQKPNPLILIHFFYKYPRSHLIHLIFAHFVIKSLRESERVFWRERSALGLLSSSDITSLSNSLFS